MLLLFTKLVSKRLMTSSLADQARGETDRSCGVHGLQKIIILKNVAQLCIYVETQRVAFRNIQIFFDDAMWSGVSKADFKLPHKQLKQATFVSDLGFCRTNEPNMLLHSSRAVSCNEYAHEDNCSCLTLTQCLSLFQVQYRWFSTSRAASLVRHQRESRAGWREAHVITS